MTYTKKMHYAIRRDAREGRQTMAADLLDEIERLQKENERLTNEIIMADETITSYVSKYGEFYAEEKNDLSR